MEKFLKRTKYYHVNKYATYCELNILIYLTYDDYVNISATILRRYTILMLLCSQLTHTNYHSHKHMRLMGFDIITNTGEKPMNINVIVQLSVISLQKCICSLTGVKFYQCKCNGNYYSDMGWQTGHSLMTLYQYSYLYYHLPLSTGEYTCTSCINTRNGIVTYSIYHYVE